MAVLLLTLLILTATIYALFFSIRNARGVFIIYFFAGAVLPYGLYLMQGQMPTFLGPFLQDPLTDDTAFALAVAFCVSLISSTIVLRPVNIAVTPMRIRPSRLEVFALTAILFALIYIALSVAFAGSLQNAILSAYARVRTNSSLANLRSVFFWGCIVFTTFSYYGWRFSRPRLRTKLLISISLVMAAFLAVIDGGRAVLVLFILSLFVPQVLKARTVKLLSFGALSAALIGAMSYLMLTWRYLAQGAEITADRGLAIEGAFTGLTFFDHVQISIQYAQDVGFNYGLIYLNAVVSFIPRALFPGKATPFSAEMRGYLYGDETGGIPPGLFGEAYIVGGLLGVVIVSVLFGRLLLATATLCNRARHADCPVRYAAAGIMVPLVGFTLVRGGLDIGFLRVGLPFFWTYVAILLATGTRRMTAPKVLPDPPTDGALQSGGLPR